MSADAASRVCMLSSLGSVALECLVFAQCSGGIISMQRLTRCAVTAGASLDCLPLHCRALLPLSRPPHKSPDEAFEGCLQRFHWAHAGSVGGLHSHILLFLQQHFLKNCVARVLHRLLAQLCCLLHPLLLFRQCHGAGACNELIRGLALTAGVC